MRPIIIAIVGNSGSGKTYMAEFLRTKLNVPVIVSYTTRPKRPEEVNGIDHLFINESQKPDRSAMLAYTRFGGYEYSAVHSQVPQNGVCSHIIDERGLEEITRNFNITYNIVAVLITCPEDVLTQRCIPTARIQRGRERKHLNEKFYDCVIRNDASKEEFEYKIMCKFNKL